MLVDDIVTTLTTANLVGGATNWVAYKMFWPDTPDRAVLIVPLAGDAPDTRNIITEPRFQVIVRAGEYENSIAQTKIDAIVTALHAREDLVGSAYVYVNAETSGYSIVGRDASRRPMLGVTFRTMKDA